MPCEGLYRTKPRGICSVKACHAFSVVSQSFDEPNLVSHGGLLTAAVLTERIGLWPLVAGALTVPGPTGVNSAAKTATVLAGMLSGAHSIDDLDVLRAGGTPALFDDLRGPVHDRVVAAGVHPRQRPSARRGQPAGSLPVVGGWRRPAPTR